jgi:tellurite resistance protein TerC
VFETAPLWLWISFTVFVLGMLALDLGVFHRSAHAVSLKEAGMWSAVWIALSLVFNAIIYNFYGAEVGLQFLTGYLIEKSLSVDNIFVFVLIFSYFSVPAMYQHRVLFWGIFGALVMRAVMIATGAALLERFHWIIYIFGAFLVYTGIKMFKQEDEEIHPEDNPVVRLVTRYVPITRHYEGESFFTSVDGRRSGTLLLLVLVIVEVTDLIFAVDSIPAILAVTTDRFILYTSNVFAILGLRSFFFLLAGVVEKFHYLKIGLAIVLIFIGVKMLVVAAGIHIPIGISLAVVAVVLASSVVASLIWPQKADFDIEIDLPAGFNPPFDDSEVPEKVSQTVERR